MRHTCNPCAAPDWVPDAIFYQIFPDRFYNGDPSNDPSGTEPCGNTPTRDNFFGGDLQGILQKLDYLQGLGVNALYLNPIFRARTNHKYDTCDYFEVDPAFGSNDLLKELVRELHRRDMRIILDGVFNHCGDGFWAFEDVKAQGAASPYADWFIVHSYPIRANPSSYYTFDGAPYLPKLNLNHRPVQEYILKVATYWMKEAGIDGWRLDVPWKVPFNFWREFRSSVKRVNPDAYLVGEIWRDARPWIKGDTFDGVMNYCLRDYVLAFCVYQTMDAEDFDYELTQMRKDHGQTAEFMLNLLGSHDTPRTLTLCEGDINRAVMALAFLMTYIGAPMIYYGDEVGMTGGDDPLCRGRMVWDEALWNHRLRELYGRLIRVRRQHPALRRGIFRTIWTFNGIYAYSRVYDDDALLILLNPRVPRDNMAIPIGDIQRSGKVWRDVLSGEEYRVDGGHLMISELPAPSALVMVPYETGDFG